jgi:hypothetical protein
LTASWTGTCSPSPRATVVEKGPKKKPRQKKGGTSMWVRGGRLAFSLHKAIPPSFTLHKAKVPCLPRAKKWPRCRRGQFLPDTQIYWSRFFLPVPRQFAAWGIVPPAFITRIRQLCACRGPFPAHIFAAGDPTAWLGMSDSNSETSVQNIPLKGRTDFGKSSRILATETIRV